MSNVNKSLITNTYNYIRVIYLTLIELSVKRDKTSCLTTFVDDQVSESNEEEEKSAFGS